MTTSATSKSLQLYRGLLKAIRHYPSSKKASIEAAIKQDFREKRGMAGEELQKALWLGEMELQRLRTWMPTAKQMVDGGDLDLKL